VTGEGRLPGAGISEQAENLWRTVATGTGLEPIGHGFQGVILVGGELRHVAGSIKQVGKKEKNRI
jgi:hypothetical protein